MKKILVLILVSFAVFSFFHFLPGIVMWDEAGYIWEGYRVWEALRAGDWRGFLDITKSQFYYPFFQSWFLGLATYLFPYNFFTARLVSFLLLFPTACLVYLLAVEVGGKKSLTSWLALFFLFTSPLTLYYYSTAMKEGLGTLFTLLALYLYIKARQKKKLSLFFWAGIVILFLTLTKYNYGVLVLIILVLEFLFWRCLKENLVLFLPVILVLGIWLSPSGRFRDFLLILQNRFTIHLSETTVLGHLLYYPLVLAFAYFFSWLACLLAVIGFLYSSKYWRKNFSLRILAFLFLINFFLAERHMGNNQGRFIFTSIPAFLVVANFGLAEILPKVYFLFRRWFAGRSFWLGFFLPLIAIGGGVILKDLILLPKFLRPTASHESETAVFYEQDQKNDWRFNFNRQNWPHIYTKPESQETPKDVFNFIFSQVDLTKNVVPLNFTNEFSPLLFNFYFALGRKQDWGIRQAQYNNFYIVLEIHQGGMLDTADFRRANLKMALEAKKFLTSGQAAIIAKKDFPSLGLSVCILAN